MHPTPPLVFVSWCRNCGALGMVGSTKRQVPDEGSWSCGCRRPTVVIDRYALVMLRSKKGTR